ncbi:MAG TPA: S8 family serine peptidase [Fimbriimonadaceae bacterium]|nr:S8 family serine peptidase [Fimbriimonadaceae bacterium]
MRVPKSLPILAMAAWSVASQAQSYTNQGELLRLAHEYNLRALFSRESAEAWAQSNNFVTRFERGSNEYLVTGLRNGVPVIYGTTALNAADTVSADEVWSGGSAGLNLSGQNVIMGIWDGGKVEEHTELTGRVTWGDAAASFSQHATAVGGVMAATGIDSMAIGFSFQGGLNSFDFDNDHSEMATAATGGLRISNHSYGNIGGWFFNLRNDGKWVWLGDVTVSTTEDYKLGFYGTDAVALDNIAFNAPNLLICQAAGNERGNGPSTQPEEHWIFTNSAWALSTDVRDKDGGASGYDTLMEQATAKNIVSVGAVDEIIGGYTEPDDLRSLTSASFGPTDDGRIKPDLVACGGNVYTLDLSNGYIPSFGGSSMSAPNVSGAAGLLTQHYRNTHNNQEMSASMLKAAMLHTTDECGPGTGPDYQYGWGLLNVKKAAELISLDQTRSTTINELIITNVGSTNVTFSSDGTEPIRVTMVWTDPAGTASNVAVDPSDSRLVNDLDMRLVKGNQTFFPYVLDPSNPSAAATTGDNFRDNVEQIYVANPEAGLYTIPITYKGAGLLPSGGQVLTLIITGQSKYNLTNVSVAPGSGIGGTTFTGTVTLDNAAPAGGRTVSLSDNSAAAQTPAQVVVPQGQSTVNFNIPTVGVASDTPVIVTGTMNGVADTGNMTVLRSTLDTIAITPDRVTGGFTSAGTVTMNGIAPPSGANVLLSSNNTAVATVPGSVTIAGGATSANFTLTAIPVTVPTTVVITATRGGVTRTKSVIVRAAVLSSVFFNPYRIAGSQSTTGRATLSGPAPTNGLTVTLTDNSPFVTVPASVFIPAGESFATFTADTTVVTQNETASVTGQLGTVRKSGAIYLFPTTLDSLDLNPTSVTGGSPSTGTVNLSLPAPQGGANVLLSTSNPLVATVPSVATVGSGQLSKSFQITTFVVPSTTNVTITASRNSIAKTRVLTVRP